MEQSLEGTSSKRTLIQNEVTCGLCGETIYSGHRHDFKYCKCGNVAVDGGLDYIRRVGGVYSERSMMMDQTSLSKCVEAVKQAQTTGRNPLGITLAVIRALRDAGLLNDQEFQVDVRT